MDTNTSLTNLDLRENEGLSMKYHRELALGLLKNIQNLKDSGELEEDIDTSGEGGDSTEFRSKFVK